MPNLPSNPYPILTDFAETMGDPIMLAAITVVEAWKDARRRSDLENAIVALRTALDTAEQAARQELDEVANG